jgi:hypothetical protein
MQNDSGHTTDFRDRYWKQMVRTLQDVFYEPDLQAQRAAFSAIAAHELSGQPVWPMLVAPPGSAKTTILEPLDQFDYVHLIDKLTPNTFLSGQIRSSKARRAPSLLNRIGSSGVVVFPDFSTVLAMKPDDKASILADLRRIFDGHLRKEVGTSGEPLEWSGRITCAVCVTPDIDRHHSVFQSLGERFLMIRWHRPGGEDDAEKAALRAMNQKPTVVRKRLSDAVRSLFEAPLPKEITISDVLQGRLAALGEFVARARTHVARGDDKHLIYVPEAEAPTRLSQQLSQLAKGSARLSRRTEVNGNDLALVTRVGFDCIPSIRAHILKRHLGIRGFNDAAIPKATKSYVQEDLTTLGLLQAKDAARG